MFSSRVLAFLLLLFHFGHGDITIDEDYVAPEIDEEPENFDDLFEDLEGTHRFHADLKVQHKFIDEKDGFMPLGVEVPVLFGLAHVGEAGEFKISGLQVFLHTFHDYENYLQNFTRVDVDKTLLPGEEVTFETTFRIWDRLPIARYQISGDVYYNSLRDLDEEIYMTKVFNETITLYHKGQTVDYQLFMMFFMIFGIFAAGYYGYGETKSWFATQKRKRKYQ